MSYFIRSVLAFGAMTTVLLSACKPSSDTSDAEVANQASVTIAQASPVAAPPSTAAAAGPEMLSTVGLYDRAPVTSVKATQGTFAIENVDGVEALTLNGKPTRYVPRGTNAPQPVAANSGISLVGVFELPGESVAWVVIIGGSACAGSHVLVGARGGVALPGQDIPGCDDRGTMRRAGGKIKFEAGGSEGTYDDGLITITAEPASDAPYPSATGM